MKRREFIQGGVAVLSAFPMCAKAVDVPKPSRIRVGFLGATYSHAVDKIKYTMKSEDWEFVGVWEESDGGREICRKLGARVTSQSEVLERSEVVMVESEVRDHARHALIALRANRHVHIEKPPASTVAEMGEIVGVAREKKRLVQCGYMWRSHPGFVKILEAARQGWLGEIFLVRGHMANYLAASRRPDWAEYPGGGMFEQGSHLIDAMVRLLGRPKNVVSILRHHSALADTLKDNNVAVLEYDRALALLTNSTMQVTGSPERSFEVLGTNGSAVLQPIEPPVLKFDLAKAAGPYSAGPQLIPLSYQRYIGDFIELAAAVRGERELAVSLETELLVQETLVRVCG